MSTVSPKQARAIVNANVQESVSGIAVAKGFRQEQALYDEFERVNQKTYRIGLVRGLTLENIFPALDALAAAGTRLSTASCVSTAWKDCAWSMPR